MQIFHLLVLHPAPVQPDVQEHVLGTVQVPPFEQVGEQIATMKP